ncbi:MAG: carboxypeptidase-like regulatory domain-containing protein [Candidatus Sulfopaludibacter sp.]|nr:carboxypeptidase-like regulatory domain-containing protein [Candidatus Sulfopaludibacter sp.]
MRSCLLLLLAVAARAGSVEGTVTNAVTGAPVKRATVTLVSPSLRARYIAGTDDQGQFQFPDVEAAADYVLEAGARGFTMLPETRQALKEKHPIAVTGQESVKGATVKLVPHGAINGKITDADGEPVRGVSVQALQYQYRASGRRLDSRADAVTDANGQYRIYFLPPGRYLVRAYLHKTPAGPAEPSPHVHNFIPAEGFLPAYYPGSPEAAGGAVVEVKAGADLNGYDLQLARAPAFHVRGRVDGAQPKARVALAPCSTPSLDFASALFADVRPDGTFDARGITPGQYCLAVERNGGRLATADAQVAVKDADLNGIALAAPARVNLEGAVQMEPSQVERPPKLVVMLADLDTPGLLLGIGQVQDNGTFSMRNVQAGPADMTVAGQPPGDYLKSFRFAERNVPGAIRSAAHGRYPDPGPRHRCGPTYRESAGSGR